MSSQAPSNYQKSDSDNQQGLQNAAKRLAPYGRPGVSHIMKDSHHSEGPGFTADRERQHVHGDAGLPDKFSPDFVALQGVTHRAERARHGGLHAEGGRDWLSFWCINSYSG